MTDSIPEEPHTHTPNPDEERKNRILENSPFTKLFINPLSDPVTYKAEMLRRSNELVERNKIPKDMLNAATNLSVIYGVAQQIIKDDLPVESKRGFCMALLLIGNELGLDSAKLLLPDIAKAAREFINLKKLRKEEERLQVVDWIRATLIIGAKIKHLFPSADSKTDSSQDDNPDLPDVFKDFIEGLDL